MEDAQRRKKNILARQIQAKRDGPILRKKVFESQTAMLFVLGFIWYSTETFVERSWI